MSALATFLDAEVKRRDWSMEEFARRADISLSAAYQIVRDGKDNVRMETLDGIAHALGMSAEDLLRAAKAQSSDDPVEQAIWRSVPEMRQAVDGIHHTLVPTVIQDVFDRAIEGAKDIAKLFWTRARVSAR